MFQFMILIMRLAVGPWLKTPSDMNRRRVSSIALIHFNRSTLEYTKEVGTCCTVPKATAPQLVTRKKWQSRDILLTIGAVQLSPCQVARLNSLVGLGRSCQILSVGVGLWFVGAARAHQDAVMRLQ